MVKKLQEKGIGILITDHNVRETLGICTRAYILSNGEIIETGTAKQITESEVAKKYYLGQDFKM